MTTATWNGTVIAESDDIVTVEGNAYFPRQAVRSATGDDDVPATSQLTVTYLRPGTPGPLEVTARVRTRGEHLTVCDADVEQDGRSLVHAVATFALLHG